MSDRPRALVISNIAWTFVWQRHQTIASMLARDFDVTFCELPGIRRVKLSDASRIWTRLRETRRGDDDANPGLGAVRIVRPRVLPSTNRMFCAWNARLLKKWTDGDPLMAGTWDVVLNYSPSRAALQLLEILPHRCLIYDCTDDWLAVRGIPEHLGRDERRLLGKADLTLVPSRGLLERKTRFAKRIERLPHGALVDRFLPAGNVSLRPSAPPAILYYGHLHRQHLDFALIEEIAFLRPAWRIILVGPVRTPHRFPPNVETPGQSPHEGLRGWIEQAHVLILPYVINRYTEAVLPAKSYECLATGLPVVATRLPELTAEFDGLMRFGDSPDSVLAEIESALAEPAEAAARRIAVARENTWDDRYSVLRGHLVEFGVLNA
jgi:glycosyltransferase involved in cell wall biosynthesis